MLLPKTTGLNYIAFVFHAAVRAFTKPLIAMYLQILQYYSQPYCLFWTAIESNLQHTK